MRTLRAAVAIVGSMFVACSHTDPAALDGGIADGEASDDSGTDDTTCGPGAPNIFATGSGIVDVFLNGSFLGKTASPGALLSRSCALQTGENIIVLRATKGGASQPFAVGQFEGSFGKAGTSGRWKARA